MNVSEMLSKAWGEVQKAGLPPELNEVAFQEAVRLLSGEPSKGAKAKEPSPPNLTPDMDRERTEPSGVSADEFFDRVANETGQERARLEQLFHLDKGVPQLNLPARRLGANTRARIVAVAQLLPVVRQYGLNEPETSTKVVRAELSRLHSMDEKHVNTYFANLEGITYAGPSADKKLKVRPPAVAAFNRIVAELLGGEGPAEA